MRPRARISTDSKRSAIGANRPRAGRSQQGDQQRHPHEPGIGKRGHQSPQRGVVPADAAVHRDGDAETHHHQRAQQVDAGHRRVEQFGDRRRRAEAVQHARQGKEQHETVEPRDGFERQHAPLRRHKARQHQREKRKRDGQDVEHRGILAACARQPLARLSPAQRGPVA